MTTLDPGLVDRLRAALEDELPAAVELRHRLHADPRPSGHETDTAIAVLDALAAGPGIQIADTGRALRLDSRDDSAARASVALRAELDALPIVERSGLSWSATGRYMHACGHDVHLAAVVAAARAITSCKAPTPVTVLLQPREEGAPSGAHDVVESGIIEKLNICSVIGAHVQPRVPVDVLAITTGLVNASVDEFEITITGKTGHVGYPHTTFDPLLALAAAVVNLQQIPARRVDPVKGAICIVTEIRAGTAANVIPGDAWARGSLRLMNDDYRAPMAAMLTGIVEHTAASYGCHATVRLIPGEPPLVNNPSLATDATAVISAWGYRTTSDFRSFGADDFAYYCKAVPSLMIFVGVSGAGLHDPQFVPPDTAIRTVAHALLSGYMAASDRC